MNQLDKKYINKPTYISTQNKNIRFEIVSSPY